ncbi:MAG: hypothetical protein JWO38_4899 [Gemmataceae bacterium]|nr:hypothetical protein [Gemmataceae bacterium]
MTATKQPLDLVDQVDQVGPVDPLLTKGEKDLLALALVRIHRSTPALLAAVLTIAGKLRIMSDPLNKAAIAAAAAKEESK